MVGFVVVRNLKFSSFKSLDQGIHAPYGPRVHQFEKNLPAESFYFHSSRFISKLLEIFQMSDGRGNPSQSDEVNLDQVDPFLVRSVIWQSNTSYDVLIE